MISVFADPKADLRDIEGDPNFEVVRTRGFARAAAPIITQSLGTRMRPAVGGASISHRDLGATSGTLAICCHPEGPVPVNPLFYYLLSCNHVLTNDGNVALNSDGTVALDDGNAILQPGRTYGGNFPADVIGWLTAAVPVQLLDKSATPPTNFVDAAIATGHFHDLRRDVYWTGHLLGCDYLPAIGDIVQRTGANTGSRMGRITQLDATIEIEWGEGTARFTNQILYEGDSFGGDSGSLLVNSQTRRAVGLVFARETGDDGTTKYTLANHLLFVEQLLGIRVASDGVPLPPFTPPA